MSRDNCCFVHLDFWALIFLQEPHVCVEFHSLNFLRTDIWPSDSLNTHVTLCVLFVLLFGHCAPSNNSAASLLRVLPMSKWIRRWKPIWIPYGGNFQKAFVAEWEQEVHSYEYSDREMRIAAGTNVPVTTRLTTPATRTRVTTGHIRPPKLQSPNVYMYPRTRGGTPHVNTQLTQAVFPRPNRVGNHIQIQVRRRSPGYLRDISSASPQRRKRIHQ